MTPVNINNLPLDVLCKIATESENLQCFRISKIWNGAVKDKCIEQFSIPFKNNQNFSQLNKAEKFHILKNLIFHRGINHQHFQVITDLEISVLNTPKDIELNQLITFFMQSYLRWAIFDIMIMKSSILKEPSKEQFSEKLKQWIDCIQNRLDGIGVPQDKKEKEIYYTHLEMLLKNIIVKLNQFKEIYEYHDLEFFNHLGETIWIAVMNSDADAANLLLAAVECNTKLFYASRNSFENQLKQELHMLRRNILREISLEIESDDIESSPVYLTLIQKMGVMRGIFGGISAQYNDPYSRKIDIATAYNKFDSKYTREAIITHVKQRINETGLSSLNFRHECIKWFNNYIPNSWKSHHKDWYENQQQFLSKFVCDSENKIQTEAIVYMLKEMHILTSDDF